MRMVCVCACACGVSVCVCVCVPRHKSKTNLNVVTGSTVLTTGPMVLYARTSVNVSSGQRLILSLPSPLHTYPRGACTSPKLVHMFYTESKE